MRSRPSRPSGHSEKARFWQWAYDSLIELAPRIGPGVETDWTTRGVFRRMKVKRAIASGDAAPIFDAFGFNAVTYYFFPFWQLNNCEASVIYTLNCTVADTSLPLSNIDTEHAPTLVPLPATCRVESPYNHETTWVPSVGSDELPGNIVIAARGVYTFTIPVITNLTAAEYRWELQT